MTTTITSDRGDEIAFDQRGSGHPLLFMPGAGPHRGNDPVTNRTAELAAAAGITTLVHDRLGRGESPATHPIDLSREIEALGALIDVVGGRAVICGHSSGCAIALAAAARGLPIDALVLWEAPFGDETSDTATWAAGLEHFLDAGDLEAAFLHFMRDVPAQFVDGWRATGEYDSMVAQAASLLPDAQALGWASSAPLPELIGAITVPVKVFVGTEAFPGMAEAAESIANAIPDASCHTLPSAGHTWDADDMAHRLARFVTTCRKSEDGNA